MYVSGYNIFCLFSLHSLSSSDFLPAPLFLQDDFKFLIETSCSLTSPGRLQFPLLLLDPSFLYGLTGTRTSGYKEDRI
jgi:hypothetical protein